MESVEGSQEGENSAETANIKFKQHVKFFKRVLAVLPNFLSFLDSNRFISPVVII